MSNERAESRATEDENVAAMPAASAARRILVLGRCDAQNEVAKEPWSVHVQ